MINRLLEYFSQPINYTLTAYVSKVMVSLLNRKTAAVFILLTQFLTRFFSNEEESNKIFDSIFEHLGSRSVVDLLTRIFTIENKNFIDERYKTYVRMVQYLSKTDKIDVKQSLFRTSATLWPVSGRSTKKLMLTSRSLEQSSSCKYLSQKYLNY